MRKMKWFIPMMAAMLFVAVVAPGSSEAGKKWSGADPIFTVNGERFNVRIEWPSEFDCDIKGDIMLNVFVEKGAAVNFHSESVADFNGCMVSTKTKVSGVLKENSLGVETRLKAREDFPVKTKVDRNRLWIAEFVGSSNERFRGVIHLDKVDDGVADPALPENYNGEEYTYDDDIYTTITKVANRLSKSRKGWGFGFNDRQIDNDDSDDDDGRKAFRSYKRGKGFDNSDRGNDNNGSRSRRGSNGRFGFGRN